MKRLIILLAGAAIMSVGLAGCQSSNNEGAPESSGLHPTPLADVEVIPMETRISYSSWSMTWTRCWERWTTCQT
ncbi:hypothetical protein ACFLYP_04320 [Chloroflexota bacterium]